MAETKTENNKDNSPSQKNDAAKSTSAPAISSQDVGFGKDIILHISQPLELFNKGKVKAFKATGQNKIFQNLIVYVCDKKLTPRRNSASKYFKINAQNILKLVRAGVAFIPEYGEERFCLVYENTIGGPLLDPKEKSHALGWKHDDVILNIAKPFIQTLTAMRNVDQVHGEIWPANIYYQGTETSDKVVLGECLTAPASYHLPALYEPVERALADPISKGEGTLADDLYAFGVSLAVILRSHDPMQGKTDREIIQHKIEKGTYATLLSKDRLSGATLELLRGLLYDDPEQRWTLEDLEAWEDGRRLSPKQSPKRVKAARPLLVNDKKYVRPEILAMDMTHFPDQMMRLIEAGELDLWIDRAVEDKSIKVRVEQITKDISGFDRTEGYNARGVAAMATALYPNVPIHYDAISFQIEGFGKALTKAYQENSKLQHYIDVMRSMFVISCMRMQKISNVASYISKFDNCRGYLSKTALNLGLERCLYYLNPECHCLSPILDKYYVQTPEDVLSALEKVCDTAKPKILFDRHIIAFLSVKDRRNVDPYLPDLSATERYKRMLGQIRTLATIQKRSGLEKSTAIAEWISQNLEDVYERFHDAKKRESVKDTIDKLKKTGDLAKIALCFDDPHLFQSDLSAFYQAMRHYAELEKEEEKINYRLEKKKDYGYRSGQQVASVISVLMAFIIMIIAAYFTFVTG